MKPEPLQPPKFSSFQHRTLAERNRINNWFRYFCVFVASMSVVVLVVLLGSILFRGTSALSWRFLTSNASQDVAQAGIFNAMVGSMLLCLACGAIALPVGVASAVFIEEYKPKNRTLRVFHGWFQLLIANLAGVPSVVYGLLGLIVFVKMFGLFGSLQDPNFEFGVSYSYQILTPEKRALFLPVKEFAEKAPKPEEGMKVRTASGEEVVLHVIGRSEKLPADAPNELRQRTVKANAKFGPYTAKSWYYISLPLGKSVLSGAFTLMLVILPVIIISSQESIRAVPKSLREGAYGLGCTTWQVVRNVTLPAAIPGIMTGAILSMSRAMGEAAPILVVSGAAYVTMLPQNLMDDYTIMPLQIFQWADHHQPGFYDLAASGIIVLLVVLLVFNGVAVYIRQRSQKSLG